MRDYAESESYDAKTAAGRSLRGLAAAEADQTPAARAGGIWFEMFEGPSKDPMVEKAVVATKLFLTVFTGVGLVYAVAMLTAFR